MSFISDSGYIPSTIEELMDLVMAGVNANFGTTYTTDTFLGTNFYKYFYALIQRLQENEIKTSEIFSSLQQYFVNTNQMIQRPKTTAPGIIDTFAAMGYLASVKAPIAGDEGKAYICVNVDSAASDYAARKLAINTTIKDCVVAGVVTQGTEASVITLSNSQSFTFKFYLPTKIPVKLRLTIVTSANNLHSIDSITAIKQRLFDNINARYNLGKNFEPSRYYSVGEDAPWAASVLLEWSSDAGATWHSTVYSAAFNEIFTFALTDISLVQS